MTQPGNIEFNLGTKHESPRGYIQLDQHVSLCVDSDGREVVVAPGYSSYDWDSWAWTWDGKRDQ